MLWILYQPWLDLKFILVLGLIWWSWKGQAVSTDKSLPDSQEAPSEFYVHRICLHPLFLVCSTTCPGLCPTAMQPAPILTTTQHNRHIHAALLPTSMQCSYPTHGVNTAYELGSSYRYSRGIPKKWKQFGKVKSWATLLTFFHFLTFSIRNLLNLYWWKEWRRGKRNKRKELYNLEMKRTSSELLRKFSSPSAFTWSPQFSDWLSYQSLQAV